jgi:hypothetical protein
MPEDVPADPGTTPVPEGHVRLFHYAPTAALPSIRAHGLSTAHAKGETYGEPNMVWAAAGMPKHENFYTHNYVEFHAHPQHDLDIGAMYGGFGHGHERPEADKAALQEHINHLESYGSHVTMRGDVPKENIIAIHEPWHAHLRYLRESKDYYKQHPEFLREDYGDPEIDQAVRAFKAEQ